MMNGNGKLEMSFEDEDLVEGEDQLNSRDGAKNNNIALDISNDESFL